MAKEVFGEKYIEPSMKGGSLKKVDDLTEGVIWALL